MKTPDITQAQIAGGVGSLAAVLAVIYQAPERLQIPLISAVTVIAVALILADGLGIRPGRAKAVAAQHLEAAAQLQLAHQDGDDSKVPDGPVTD